MRRMSPLYLETNYGFMKISKFWLFFTLNSPRFKLSSDMIMMRNVDSGSTRLGCIHKNTISYHLERLSYDWYWASVLSLFVSDCHLYETSPSHIQPSHLWQRPKKGSRARRKLRMGSFSQVFAKEHCEVGAKAWFGVFPGCNRRNVHVLKYSSRMHLFMPYAKTMTGVTIEGNCRRAGH